MQANKNIFLSVEGVGGQPNAEFSRDELGMIGKVLKIAGKQKFITVLDEMYRNAFREGYAANPEQERTEEIDEQCRQLYYKKVEEFMISLDDDSLRRLREQLDKNALIGGMQISDVFNLVLNQKSEGSTEGSVFSAPSETAGGAGGGGATGGSRRRRKKRIRRTRKSQKRTKKSKRVRRTRKSKRRTARKKR